MLSVPKLTARCSHDLNSALRGGDCPSTPRTPRSPASVTCSAGAHRLRISRRSWGGRPNASPLLAADPAAPTSPVNSPRTPHTPSSLDSGSSSYGADGALPSPFAAASPPSPAAPQQELGEGQPAAQQAAAGKQFYDCVDVITQSLAVNLTLDEYQSLSRGGLQDQVAAAGAGAAPQQQQPGGASTAAPASLSHLSLTSADLDAMGLCNHCRYPCYLSGMPACEASHYLQMWDADACLKPRDFDAQTSLKLEGVADIAAVSSGGRANGRWKPDNQDAFLLQPTASAAAEPEPGSPGQRPAAAAIGVFDGHGRLGASASAIVKQAMADRLAALRHEEAAAAAAAGLQGAASLLDSCFSAADEAIAESGRDFSKSGCTAVLALLDRDSVSVAWAGDSRAVLGVVDMGGSLLGPAASSPTASCEAVPFPLVSSASVSMSSDGSMSGPSDSYDGVMQPLCAAVPLTEDHKPDRPAEKERIAAAGGRVTRLATDRFGNPAGPFRVFVPNCWSPGLALSRAFGDTLASTVGVTSKPEVTMLPLTPPSHPPSPAASGLCLPGGVSNAAAASCCSSSGDLAGEAAGGAAAVVPSERHVLIVASDGLWEWVSNTTAVAIASAAATAEDAAHALVEAAQKQWAVRYRGRNCDDITVVVAFLRS